MTGQMGMIPNPSSQNQPCETEWSDGVQWTDDNQYQCGLIVIGVFSYLSKGVIRRQSSDCRSHMSLVVSISSQLVDPIEMRSPQCSSPSGREASQFSISSREGRLSWSLSISSLWKGSGWVSSDTNPCPFSSGSTSCFGRQAIQGIRANSGPERGG